MRNLPWLGLESIPIFCLQNCVCGYWDMTNPFSGEKFSRSGEDSFNTFMRLMVEDLVLVAKFWVKLGSLGRDCLFQFSERLFCSFSSQENFAVIKRSEVTMLLHEIRMYLRQTKCNGDISQLDKIVLFILFFK